MKLRKIKQGSSFSMRQAVVVGILVMMALVVINIMYGDGGLLTEITQRIFDFGDSSINDLKEDKPPVRESGSVAAQDAFNNLYWTMNAKATNAPCFDTLDLTLPDNHGVLFEEDGSKVQVSLIDYVDKGIPGGTTFESDTLENFEFCTTAYGDVTQSFFDRWIGTYYPWHHCKTAEGLSPPEIIAFTQELDKHGYTDGCTKDWHPACEADDSCDELTDTFSIRPQGIIYFDEDDKEFYMNSDQGNDRLMGPWYKGEDHRSLLLYHPRDGSVCVIPNDDFVGGCSRDDTRMLDSDCKSTLWKHVVDKYTCEYEE